MKKIKMFMVLCMVFTVTMFMSIGIFASQGSDMEKVLKYYGKGEYKTVKKYNKKLSKYANETCVNKISRTMEQAYQKKVKNLGEKAIGWYLTDINNDKKADLIVHYGTCEADYMARVYIYKNKEVKYIGQTGAGHSTFHAYPGHNGFIVMSGHMGYESISLVQIKNGKLVTKKIGSREVMSYLNLGCQLRDSYMTRYKYLELECQWEYTYDGSQGEMNADSYAEYKVWDNELKQVYKRVLKKISKSKAKELRKSQKKWKKKRTKYAENKASEVYGGSMYPMVYNINSTEYTKKRIKWLINNYGDIRKF